MTFAAGLTIKAVCDKWAKRMRGLGARPGGARDYDALPLAENASQTSGPLVLLLACHCLGKQVADRRRQTE